MKYRKLRIAWSVAWGVVCLMFVALWVRSYSTAESLLLPGGNRITVMQGCVFVNERFKVTDDANVPIPQFTSTSGSRVPIPNGVGTRLKLWAIVLIALPLSLVPWFRWRFSLRTLLISMTVAAIGLGWIVYAIRK